MRPFISTTFDGITYDSPVASLCRKLERERDEARKELDEWKALSILGDTPEQVWDAWRKQVIKTQKYIREMAVWRDKANKNLVPSASVEEVKDIFNSF